MESEIGLEHKFPLSFEEHKKWLDAIVEDAEKQINYFNRKVSFYEGVKHIAQTELNKIEVALKSAVDAHERR